VLSFCRSETVYSEGVRGTFNKEADCSVTKYRTAIPLISLGFVRNKFKYLGFLLSFI